MSKNNQVPDDLKLILVSGFALTIKHMAERLGETPLEAINKAMDHGVSNVLSSDRAKAERILGATVEVSNAFLEAMGSDARVGDSAKLGKKRWLSRNTNNGFGKRG